jgi:hypothetical protein
MNKFLFTVVSCLLAYSSGATAGVVVVSKSSPLVPINTDLARRVFLGMQRTIDDRTVTVIFQRDGAAREEFNTKVLGKTDSELTAYMAARIFTGRAVAPLEVGNDDDVKRTLSNNAGAIGYISDKAVDDSVRVLVKY